MNVASAGNISRNTPWVISANDSPPALEFVLSQRTVILSWTQIAYAEGNTNEVRTAFASHDVVVTGAGLDPLLPTIAAHRVALIRESARSERFPCLAGRSIREIVVRRVEVE